MSSDLDSVTLGDLARLPGRMDNLSDRMDALIEANKKALEAFAQHSVRLEKRFDTLEGKFDTLEGKFDTVIELLNGRKEQEDYSVPSVEITPRAPQGVTPSAV
jgi:predicted nuclease with TOPRIM domain